MISTTTYLDYYSSQAGISWRASGGLPRDNHPTIFSLAVIFAIWCAASGRSNQTCKRLNGPSSQLHERRLERCLLSLPRLDRAGPWSHQSLSSEPITRYVRASTHWIRRNADRRGERDLLTLFLFRSIIDGVLLPQQGKVNISAKL